MNQLNTVTWAGTTLVFLWYGEFALQLILYKVLSQHLFICLYVWLLLMEFNVVLVLSFQPFKGLLSVYFYQLGSNQKILEEFRVIVFFSTPARPFELLPIFLSLIYLKLKIHHTIFNKYFYYEINIENYRKQISSNFNIPDKEVRKTAGENSLTPEIMLPHQQEITETFYHHKHNYSSFHPLKKPQNKKTKTIKWSFLCLWQPHDRHANVNTNTASGL